MCIYNVTTIKEKEPIDLKEIKGQCMGGFEGKKWK